MRNSSARLSFITTLGASLIVVAGCGQAENDGSTEVGTSTAPLLGVCPAASAAVGDQQRVTAFASYVVGSPTSPFDAYPCNGPLTAPVGGLTAPALANLLQTLFATGLCTTSAPTSTTVCSLPAAERVLSCTGLSAADGLALSLASTTIDLCWGAGASAFFQVSPSGGLLGSLVGSVFSVHVDPEPVLTTQILTGTNGATAAAIYENSNTPTTAIEWSSSYFPGPNLAAGTPCSVTPLPAGGTALATILAAGGFRRCD